LSDLLTEEQQVEQLKKWWKEYGLSIVSGIVIAIVVIFGWKFYSQHKTEQAQNASVIYSRMVISELSQDSQDVTLQANKLMQDYKHTPYAKLAALFLAKIDVAANNFADAQKHLKWAEAHAHVKAIKQLAKVRLAKIYINQNKLDDALSELNQLVDSSFAGLVYETRGDAYARKGNVAKAREAYAKAIKSIKDAARVRPLLQMKLDNLVAE
jgi:predicted negative regulator of RcsB-dependent stress response